MRVELYGCSFNGGVISYKTSASTDRDRTYDGLFRRLKNEEKKDLIVEFFRWNR